MNPMPERGGVPVTAITTVHKDDYDVLREAFDALSLAVREHLLAEYESTPEEALMTWNPGHPARDLGRALLAAERGSARA